MTKRNVHELIRYALGSLSRSDAKEMERTVQSDEELAAQVEMLHSLVGTASVAYDDKRQATSLWALLFRRRFLVGAATVFVIVGLIGAAWAIFREKPLLRDDFNDQWFNSQLWMPPPSMEEHMGIRERGGFMMLRNRGYLVSRSEFHGPISLTFDWQWSELGMNPLYADHLTVVLRTSGKPVDAPQYEVSDGVAITFDAWGGYVKVWIASGQPLTHPEDNIAATNEKRSVLPLPADQWHHIRITDDGTHITVSIHGEAVGRTADAPPILRVNYADKLPERKGQHIAIYNREMLNGIPHESHIDNVVVKPLTKAP